jgi:hypothetical protein
VESLRSKATEDDLLGEDDVVTEENLLEEEAEVEAAELETS